MIYSSFFTYVFLIFFLFVSCVKKPLVNTNNNILTIKKRIYPEQSVKTPEWIFEQSIESNNYLPFVGISENCSTEQQARKSALRNVVLEFANYCGVKVVDLSKTLSFSFNKSSDITDATKAELNRTEMIADAYVSRIKAKKWFVEEWGLYNSDNQIINRFYKVYVYAVVPSDEYKKVQIRNEIKTSKSLENVWKKIINIKGNANIFLKSKLSKENCYPGEKIKLILDMPKNCFLYILTYNENEKIIKISQPRQYAKVNYFRRGEFSIPFISSTYKGIEKVLVLGLTENEKILKNEKFFSFSKDTEYKILDFINKLQSVSKNIISINLMQLKIY